MVPAGNMAKCLLSVNRTTKANYHHHHHHHHHWNSYVVSDQTIFHANKKLDNTVVNTKDISKILSKLNCNKTHDHDNISLVLQKSLWNGKWCQKDSRFIKKGNGKFLEGKNIVLGKLIKKYHSQ